jgi:hypothetical protein
MRRDPYIRDREIETARQVEYYFERFPKDRYDTVVESWADIQRHIEFVLKRKREPKDQGNEGLSDQPGASSQRGS